MPALSESEQSDRLKEASDTFHSEIWHEWFSTSSLALCAVICHIAPMALYRLVCALGRHSLVTVLTRCGLPLPVYVLADEKHSRCLAAKVYLPTMVSGRVL